MNTYPSAPGVTPKRHCFEIERVELRDEPDAELDELASLYEAKGLSKETAQTVAEELTRHDAFAAHVETELHIDPHSLANPWHAAVASAGAFLSVLSYRLLRSRYRSLSTRPPSPPRRYSAHSSYGCFERPRGRRQ